jgi:hypothetical protein
VVEQRPHGVPRQAVGRLVIGAARVLRGVEGALGKAVPRAPVRQEWPARVRARRGRRLRGGPGFRDVWRNRRARRGRSKRGRPRRPYRPTCTRGGLRSLALLPVGRAPLSITIFAQNSRKNSSAFTAASDGRTGDSASCAQSSGECPARWRGSRTLKGARQGHQSWPPLAESGATDEDAGAKDAPIVPDEARVAHHGWPRGARLTWSRERPSRCRALMSRKSPCLHEAVVTDSRRVATDCRSFARDCAGVACDSHDHGTQRMDDGCATEGESDVTPASSRVLPEESRGNCRGVGRDSTGAVPDSRAFTRDS